MVETVRGREHGEGVSPSSSAAARSGDRVKSIMSKMTQGLRSSTWGQMRFFRCELFSRIVFNLSACLLPFLMYTPKERHNFD